MYKIFLLANIILSSALLQAQPQIQWEYPLGGSQGDFANHIIADATTKKFVFAGYTFSSNGNVSGNHGVLPYGDAWIGCVNESGLLWQRCLGGSGAEQANCIIRTSDGGFAACGDTYSSDGDFLGFHGGSGTDAWVAKLDNNGNLLWAKCFGGSGYDGASTIIESNDESRDLIIAGSTNSSDGDVSGWHTDTNKKDSSYPNPDVWVVRMSSEGNIKWQKCFGGTGADIANSLVQTADGSLVIAGKTNSIDGDVSGDHPDSTGKPTDDIWVVKLDLKANIQWQKCFGGSSYEVANAMIQTSDGGYAIAGTTTSNDGDVSGLHVTMFNRSDEWFVKINSSGSLEWLKCLGGDMQEEGYSLIQISDGDYVIAGWTNSENGDAIGNTNQGGNAWIVRLGKDKKIKWQKCYGRDNSSVANSIIPASDGGYIFAGYCGSGIGGDVVGYHAGTDAWVVKLLPDTLTESVSGNMVNTGIRIYPNPSSNEVHVSSDRNFIIETVSFYDIMGRQLFPNYYIENNSITCDIHAFPTGIYMARLGGSESQTWRDNIPGSLTLRFLVQH